MLRNAHTHTKSSTSLCVTSYCVQECTVNTHTNRTGQTHRSPTSHGCKTDTWTQPCLPPPTIRKDYFFCSTLWLKCTPHPIHMNIWYHMTYVHAHVIPNYYMQHNYSGLPNMHFLTGLCYSSWWLWSCISRAMLFISSGEAFHNRQDDSHTLAHAAALYPLRIIANNTE